MKKAYTGLIGASDGELAAVGDFDPKELSESFDTILKDWKSPAPFERIAMPFHAVAPEELVINTPDKAMALVLLGTNLEIRDDDPDFPALQMANMILGMGGNSRLINRLRQKEGFSYTVSSMVMPRSQDRSASLTVFANCAPANAAPCAQAAGEEWQKFVKDGATQKELDDAKKGYAEQVKVQLSNDGAITGMLARQTHLGRTMKFTEDQMNKTQSLTLDEVNAAAKKHLKSDQVVRIQAGDIKEGKQAVEEK